MYLYIPIRASYIYYYYILELPIVVAITSLNIYYYLHSIIPGIILCWYACGSSIV